MLQSLPWLHPAFGLLQTTDCKWDGLLILYIRFRVEPTKCVTEGK